MPQMGYDMQEGTLVRWLKSEDDSVTLGELIAEVGTDKAVVEIEATAAGTVLKLLVDEGTSVPVGEAIAIIGEQGEDIGEVQADMEEKSHDKDEIDVADVRVVINEDVKVGEITTASTGEIKASPIARKIASEQNIDLASVIGTGPGGRITKNDVIKAESKVGDRSKTVQTTSSDIVQTETKTNSSQITDQSFIPLNKMRSQIARVTVASKTNAPHFYVSVEVEMTKLMNVRSQINETLQDQGVKVSVNDFVVRAAIETLKKFPKFNASFINEGIQFNDEINIGIAIATEDGLIVPAVTGCKNKSIVELAQSTKDLIERSQSGKLTPDEYTGATFTVSNLGMMGIEEFTAIINPPEAGILAVGGIDDTPVAVDGEVVVRPRMRITMSCDHRVIDGAQGSRFLQTLKGMLEEPTAILL